MNKLHIPVRNLILDMDGVLWHGETPVPGLKHFFTTLEERSLNYVLATNNAMKTPDQYTAKLARFGIAVKAEQVLTSAVATATYLRQSYPSTRTAYVVGDKGLQQAMIEQAYELIDVHPDNLEASRVDIVVAGMTPNVDYRQFAIANFLINKGAIFVGTNPDVTFPSEIGPMPGAGSILAFLKTSSGIAPEVIGKPNAIMFLEALSRLSSTIDDTVMVGDRLNTDIAGAHLVGMRSVLMLSGISTKEDAAASKVQPDWIFNNLEDFTSAIPNLTI